MIRKYVMIKKCVNCGAACEGKRSCYNCGVLFLEEMPYDEWVKHCGKLAEKAEGKK